MRRTIVDASEGITYIIDENNKVLSYADRFGNIFNSEGRLVALSQD